VLSRKLEIGLLALLVAAAGAYAIGLFTGLVTVVGYGAKTEAQVGASRTTRGALEFGIPVWLGERHAIRADFDIDARFGAVILRVKPPHWMSTSLQSAVAYVEGKRTGSVLFVAEAAGWYDFEAEGTPNGGPRCGQPYLDAKHIIFGDSKCPTYDVTYRVTWRIAGDQDLSRGLRV
jgi:hypothetical protein